MLPIELLQGKLTRYEKSLKKSIGLFNAGKLDFETHKIHVSNLNSLIIQYKSAIDKLTNVSSGSGVLPN